MKTKLEDWNKIWRKLESQFCILAKKIIHHRPREPMTIWTGESERKALSFTLPSPSHWPQLSKFVLRFTGILNKEKRGKSKKWGSR